ncbi:hypothetical protein [Thermincola potens]|uniref:hypothetical protein n=1 Tax=Thermincola potens TaxID=863643 RepID=UPI0002E08024|nr:hypothetical protein [Thermincola potens]
MTSITVFSAFLEIAAADTYNNRRVGGVLRLPLRSDCARRTAAREAGGSRMFEDGEGRREVRRSTYVECLNGRRPDL